MQVDALWPGGELGLNLTGVGYNKITMRFSYRRAVDNHIEFGSRLIGGGSQTGDVTDHETSTAGIIIAKGENLLARGIAYESSLNIINSLQGGTTELANLVFDNNLELASSSFGTLPYYSNVDSIYDAIAYTAKQFLYVNAGGGHSSISGQGKNMLSVGSVYALSAPYSGPGDIVDGGGMAGPSHDGRIKPDIVAPGGPTTVCLINDAYGLAGPATSYSAPAAAGVGVLLQQHYQNTHYNTPMLSSELKGLLIHTAEEAGPAPGPDVQFGWGLINAKRAAEYITADVTDDMVISSHNLNEGGTYNLKIYSNGEAPIKVTVCWIDPPGKYENPNYWNNYTIDPSPRLKNDLDLKILKDNTTYYPWTLNPSDPAGVILNDRKNQLDNIEQVYISDPTPGIYTIEIDHDGMLDNDGVLTDGTQLFSMIISGNTTPRKDKKRVQSDLQSFYPTPDNKINKRLENAIDYISSSLNNDYWQDGFYLTDEGKNVFEEERKAINELENIVKDKKTDFLKNESLAAIITLTEIDKLLAQLMIDKAIANSGDNKIIERALKEMEKAQAKYDDGKYSIAVGKYKTAWNHASNALKKVGLSKININQSTDEIVDVVPFKYKLNSNYPNPFNPTTTITYNLVEADIVLLSIYNIVGERVRILEKGIKTKGTHSIVWNGKDDHGNKVSAGIYFYELRAGKFKQARSMVFMK